MINLLSIFPLLFSVALFCSQSRAAAPAIPTPIRFSGQNSYGAAWEKIIKFGDSGLGKCSVNARGVPVEDCKSLAALALQVEQSNPSLNDEPSSALSRANRVVVEWNKTGMEITMLSPETCLLLPSGSESCKPNVLSPAQQLLVKLTYY